MPQHGGTSAFIWVRYRRSTSRSGRLRTRRRIGAAAAHRQRKLPYVIWGRFFGNVPLFLLVGVAWVSQHPPCC
ncbi:MAG: hypothetical protein U0232_08795 [Thermomicrobiales bacterium]